MRLNRPKPIPSLERSSPQLRVMQLVATRRGDAERGPEVRLHPDDAVIRFLVDGELVWIQGPRVNQIAPLVLDHTVAPYTCTLRDVGGVDVSEFVRVVKPDLDTPPRQNV